MMKIFKMLMKISALEASWARWAAGSLWEPEDAGLGDRGEGWWYSTSGHVGTQELTSLQV